MGFTSRATFRLISRESNAAPGAMPDWWIDSVMRHFDQGTQRAILRLYRSAPSEVLARAGERLGEIRCPALVVWGEEDPYIPTSFARDYTDALGGPTELDIVRGAGHWPWVDRPELVDRVAGFLNGARPLIERAAPALLAAAIGVAYALLAPRTGDLPAHVFRAELFGREGFTIWNGQWYSGHHTPAYSVLFPPLAWLVGPWVAGAASGLAATALFEPLARERFGAGPARLAALVFALGAMATVLAGRLTFALGVAIGVGALLALERRRSLLAAALAAATSLASPVAGLFLALVGVAVALTTKPSRARGAGFAAAALAPPAALVLAFPEGGDQPFVASSFAPALVLVLAFAALVPGERRGLRVAAGLYALALTASFLVPTPMGGNAVRLGQVAGAAVAAGALLAPTLSEARRAAGALLVGALLVWSVVPAVRDLRNAGREPSTQAAYFAPLVGFLERNSRPADRVEVVLTREHWEAAEVARRVPIARGWLRSTDRAVNPIFYGGEPLGDATYERWLRERAIRFVALADAPLDYSARAEAALVAREPAYLRPRWRDANWRVYEVVPDGAPSARGGPVRVSALRPEGALLVAAGPGRVVVPVRHTPYWQVPGGCVAPAGPWTFVELSRPGTARLEIDFSAARITARGRRCAPAPTASSP